MDVTTKCELIGELTWQLAVDINVNLARLAVDRANRATYLSVIE